MHDNLNQSILMKNFNAKRFANKRLFITLAISLFTYIYHKISIQYTFDFWYALRLNLYWCSFSLMWTYISEKVYFCFVCSNIFAQNSKNITQGGIKQVRIRKQKRNRASIFVLFLRMKVILSYHIVLCILMATIFTKSAR